MKKVLYSKPYSYLVIEKDQDLYLTYFTGGPVEIDICVKLTKDEKSVIDKEGEVSITKIIEALKSDRNEMLSRRVTPSVRP
ncbi:MAG: hypothetical protein CMK83_13400 [Pseudomonadales bacterium]|nr:hypothetical protein [Pseudomonadales bacterium]MBI27942.1 hypothetical protein [Pseudomonadales bacterium]HBO93621.1 hypothetical protein [Gammaproteobacteria bacterium]|tara:strand:+ start:1786 stop:2028 length:243 start_codon:yes stop_codon:yes gene_type:complete